MTKKPITFLFFLLLIVVTSSLAADNLKVPSQSINDRISEIQKLFMKVKPIADSLLNERYISGLYSDLGTLLEAYKVISFGGKALYLFPDETYIYSERMDIGPSKLIDKGKWKVLNGKISLQTDGSIPDGSMFWGYEYIPMIIEKNKKENIFLMSSDEYSMFIEEGRDTPEFSILLHGYERINTFSSEEYKKIKKEQMEKLQKSTHTKK